MKLAATVALAFLVVQAPLPGTQQQPQPPKASIEGSVLRADNGEPIAKVQLTLSRVVPPPPPGQTTPVPGTITAHERQAAQAPRSISRPAGR